MANILKKHEVSESAIMPIHTGMCILLLKGKTQYNYANWVIIHVCYCHKQSQTGKILYYTLYQLYQIFR